MQFYFIRHAQSQNNLLWDTTGSSVGRSHDPQLTKTGERQAELLARYLAHSDPAAPIGAHNGHNSTRFGITHIYTSLMLRAVATAARVADALGLPLQAWEEIHETGGLYLEDATSGERVGQHGSDRAYFAAHYPNLVLPDGYAHAGWWNRPYEEFEQVLGRAERVYAELLKRHGGTEDRVAVVSHGGFYTSLFQTIFKVGEPACWFTMNNVGITRIDFEEDAVKLVYANRVDFLPPDLVT